MSLRGNQSVVLFLMSDLITQFGAGVILTSSNWYVLNMTGSNSMVAASAAANTISGLITSLLGGSLADMFGAKKVALVSHCVRLLLIAIPAILLSRFGFHMAFVLLLALNNGIGWNLYYPASKAFIQELSDSRSAMKINSAAEISMQVGLFASGAVAGLLYRYTDFLIILAVSACMFIVGIMMLFAIHVTSSIPTSASQAVAAVKSRISLLTELKNGVAYLVRNIIVAIWCVVLYTPFIIGNVNQTLLAGYAQGPLGAGSVEFGVIQSLWGVGACAAGLLSAVVARKLDTNHMIVIGIGILTLFGLVEWLTSSIVLTCVMTFAAGFADALIRIVLYSKLMEYISPLYFSRVLSLMNVVSLIVQTAVSQSAGMLMDVINPASGYALIVIIGVLSLILAYRYPVHDKLNTSESQ